MNVLFQIGGDSWTSWIVWFLFMMVFFFFYPRIMVSQIMWRLEKTARDMERMSDKSRNFIMRRISKAPEKAMRESVNRFFEFFSIAPAGLDPYGSVRKYDHILRNEKDRFDYFTRRVAPKMDEEARASLQMGLAGGITVHMISKIVRHYVELVRKTKNIQIAMVLQMQLPLIERMAKAMFKGTESLAKGEPIGDGLGPLAVATMAGSARMAAIGDDMVMARVKLNGRSVYLVKASGPGGRIGFPGKAVQEIVKKNRIERVVTIDAAAKLEGEVTGTIAEGVGVAMGGPGVERSYIEDAITEKRVPIDSVVVKMSQEEAITPMRKAVKDAVPEVIRSVERSLEMTRPNAGVLVLGVGNTSGIGNSLDEARKAGAWIDNHEKELEKAKKNRKKNHRSEDDLEL
jgi:hypothetical protein